MSGVGDYIEAGLGLLGLPHCAKCAGKAKEWNNNGVAWCRDNQSVILEHLRQQADKSKKAFPEYLVIKFIAECVQRSAEDEAMKDMEYEAKVIAAIDMLRRPPCARAPKWEWQPESQEAMKRYLDEQAAYDWEYPGGHEGKGIVILGGGRYFACGYVLARAIRLLGCDLPIEWWYLTRHEMDHNQERLLGALGNIQCVRLDERTDRKPRILSGWQYKIWSIMYSRFKEVLYLDADNFPACDITNVFESAGYKEHGSVLFPDLSLTGSVDITREAFKICGLPVPDTKRLIEGKKHPRPTEYTPVESGQILVDKSRCWKALEMTRFLNDHSDFWYREPRGSVPWYFYGDKSTYYLGFHIAKTQYHEPAPCEYFGDEKVGGISHFLDGQLVLQHRVKPSTKVRVSGKNPATGLIHGDIFTEGVAELRGMWSTRVWEWKHQSPEDLDLAKTLIGDWQAEGLPRISELKLDGKTNEPRYTWRICHDPEPTMVIVDGFRVFEFLTRDGDTWVNKDMAARMSPAPPRWFSSDRKESDLSAWQDVLRNTYRLPASLAGLNVLDIDGGSGLFALEASKRGALRIASVESDASQFRHLVANAGKINGLKPVCAAVGREFKASPVTVPLDEIIRDMGRVDLMRLDLIGDSWTTLLKAMELDRVESMVGKYEGTPGQAADLNWCLVNMGYAAEVKDGIYTAHRSVTRAMLGEMPDWLLYPQQKRDTAVWLAWGEIRDNHYRLPASMDGQTVLDIGGHVGLFAYAAWVRGAKRVVSVEPSDANFAALKQNAEHMGTEAIHAAAWHQPGTVNLASAGHSGGGRIMPEGQPVATIVFDDLLRDMGQVDVLKLDCEGAEHVLLHHSKELDRVGRVVGEFHVHELDAWNRNFPGPAEYSFKSLLARLREAGFSRIEAEDNSLWGLFWAERA